MLKPMEGLPDSGDAKVGVPHSRDFEKRAVVTCLREAVELLGVCPVRVFGDDQLADAKAWVSA